jgi:predicted transglutaminase-like cysteine proteinase
MIAIYTWPDINIINYQTNTVVNEFNNVAMSSPACWVYPMAFSPDNKYFAFEKRGRLCLYDTETWKEKWCVPSL